MASCNYKLLKDAHIGYGVRMTKGEDTIPFANEPMTGMKIEDYSKLGFRISHPNMGKTIWVEFKQLPLTELYIVNGIIQDEITFVENIVSHKMELIKTSNPEYIELLKIKEEEKLEEFLTLSEAKPGEVVISALCKEGITMTYLGTWLSKSIIRVQGWRRSSYYSRDDGKDLFYLNKQSPKRAFFIVDSENLSASEQDYIDSIYEGSRPEQGRNENWQDFYPKEDAWRKEKYRLQKIEKAKLLERSSKNRYKIISYPVTSKRVTKLIKTNVFNEKFTNSDFNKKMIIYTAGSYDGSYYGKKEDNTLRILKDSYTKPVYNDFLIVNGKYDLDDSQFLTETKEAINKQAFEFFNENYICKVEPNVVMNNKVVEEIK